MKNKQLGLFSISRLSSGQFFPQQNPQRKPKTTPPLSINKLLNSCIQIKETRISRKSTIPCQVNFQLNSDILHRLEQIRINKQQFTFTLSPINLTNLRYYVLLNSSLNDPLSSIYSFQSCLTFSTNYLYPDKYQAQTLVRSEIDLAGKISQQIQQDLQQETQLYNSILDAHYWLISQIIIQLPFKRKKYKSWLFYSILILLLILITLLILYCLSLNYSLTILLGLGTTLILNICLKYVIENHIKPWLLENITHGWLSNSHNKRQIGFKLLSFTILLSKPKTVLTEILR